MPADPTAIERLLRHDRVALAVVVVGIPLAAWTWVVRLAVDMYGPMTGASAWMMTTVWDGPHLLLLWAMWAVMMAGMMLPSATPIVLLYARRRAESPSHSSLRRRVSTRWPRGYLLVWVAVQRRRHAAAAAAGRRPAAHADDGAGDADGRRRGAARAGRLSVPAAQARLPAGVPLTDRVPDATLAARRCRRRLPHGPGARPLSAWAAAGR